jgi:HNH endonuclease
VDAAPPISRICTVCRVLKPTTEFTPTLCWCRPCCAAHARTKRAARDPETAKKIRREQYLRHKEKDRIRAVERVKSGRTSQYQREWRAKNPDYYKDIYARRKVTNPDRYRSYGSTRRALKYSAEGHHTAEDLTAIRKKQNDRCAHCAVNLHGGGELDHIKSLWSGGSNWPSNLQYLCLPCNRSKGHLHPEPLRKIS